MNTRRTSGQRRPSTADLHALVQLPSLGPVTARRLAEIGVHTAADLRALGAVAAYVRLRFAFGSAITLNALYGLESAVVGCHWREVTNDRKRRLREEVAATGALSGLSQRAD